jgi:hypothetical protein
LVPSAQVEASVELETESVLVGERYVVDFRITSRTGAEIVLESLAEEVGPFLVERLVEDVLEEGPIWSRRWLRAEVLAVKPGRTVVGPWLVRSAGTSTITERVIIEAVALEGRLAVPVDSEHALGLVLPSTRWADIQQPFLGIQPDGRWAVLPASMSFRPKAQALGPRMEFRVGGQPKWAAIKITGESGAEVWSKGAPVVRID